MSKKETNQIPEGASKPPPPPKPPEVLEGPYCACNFDLPATAMHDLKRHIQEAIDLQIARIFAAEELCAVAKKHLMFIKEHAPCCIPTEVQDELECAITRFSERWTIPDKCDSDIPDRISVHYMHDNHTFTPLEGSLADVLTRAKQLGKESPYGSLCPPILCRGNKEIRRIGEHVHARDTLGDTSKWEAAVMADEDAVRLFRWRSKL